MRMKYAKIIIEKHCHALKDFFHIESLYVQLHHYALAVGKQRLHT